MDGGVLSAQATGARSPRVSLSRQYYSLSLPLLNPIPIPDPILRICRVCLNTENLHLELAVGKHKPENPFRDLNATTDAKLLHVLGVVSVFALLRQCFSLCLPLNLPLALTGWFLFRQCPFYFSFILYVFFAAAAAAARISDSSCISSHLDGRAPAARMLNMHFHFNIKI